MIRSRLVRSLGFCASVLAAAVSSLASSATLILCEEPDGCVELELLARGVAKSPPCGGHEHEVPSPEPADSRSVDSCPCLDTVIASLSENVRPKSGANPWTPTRDGMSVDPPGPALSDSRGAVEVTRPPAPRRFCRPRHSQRSVVLRI